MDKIRSFTDLKVWQEGHLLVLMVYKITKEFPREEIYGLTNQMRRSAVSIVSNIAEGFSRQGLKEKIQFYYVALGSLTELESQLLVAKDLEYLPEERFNKIVGQAIKAHKLLNKFISKTKTFSRF